MTQNLTDLTFSAQQLAAIDEALATLDANLEDLIALTTK